MARGEDTLSRNASSVMIELTGIDQDLRRDEAVDDLTFRLEAGHRHRLPGPQRCRQVHDDADDPGAGPPPRQRADRRQPYRDLGTRCGPSARCSTRSGCTPTGPRGPHLRGWRAPTGSRQSRVDEVLDLVGLTEVAGKRAGGSRWVCPSAWASRGALRRPGGAAVRRAGQRSRPGGHRLDPEVHAAAGRQGPHRAGLQPPAVRDGPHRGHWW